MAEFTKHEPGTFSWIELVTTDQDGAKKFYTNLFGWTPDDNDMGGGMMYTMLKLRGKSVGALYARNEDQKKAGVPAHWGSYIAVESADETAKKAGELGGKVLMAPFDVFDIGRMAVLQDPTGATFSLWEAKKHIGIEVRDEPNTLCWNELMTKDVDAAGKFYTSLFNYKTDTMKGTQGPYIIFKVGDKGIAGMMAITPQMGPMPSNWMPYFAVTDCDAMVAKTGTLGGKTMHPATDIPTVGRFAVLQDPQGAVFAIIKPAPQA